MSVHILIDDPIVGADKPDAARYAGTAVNPRTFLATDYLNHFNEAIMLLDMIADMPDCLEELDEWKPKTYEQHFYDSGFKDRDLCIEAYAFVSPEDRKRIEMVIEDLDCGVLEARSVLKATYAAGELEKISHLVPGLSDPLRGLIDVASGIINGTGASEDADLATTGSDGHDAAQIAIDAMFD